MVLASGSIVGVLFLCVLVSQQRLPANVLHWAGCYEIGLLTLIKPSRRLIHPMSVIRLILGTSRIDFLLWCTLILGRISRHCCVLRLRADMKHWAETSGFLQPNLSRDLGFFLPFGQRPFGSSLEFVQRPFGSFSSALLSASELMRECYVGRSVFLTVCMAA